MMETCDAQNEVLRACELSDLSPVDRARWIGWEPTPNELMPTPRERSEISAELGHGDSTRNREPLPDTIRRRAAKRAVFVTKPQRKTRSDAETLLILAGYKPTRGVCLALETDAIYRAAIHRTALRMTEGDNDKRAELSAAFNALNRD